MQIVVVGLGSNLGNPCGNILGAISLLRSMLNVKKITISRFYLSKALTADEQDFAPDFINSAVAGKTYLSPEQLLLGLQIIEKMIGRIANNKKWAARVIDLDLLLYRELKIETANLSVPHKEMHRRDFVLEPVCDLYPDAKHPVLHKTFYNLKQNITRPYVTDKFLI
jgi:2-amino-4-hydroxy-6-hydroxymethyldihydropteridine diphosphokinase